MSWGEAKTHLVRKLDSLVKHASSVEELFTTDANLLRIRLRDCCERQMFTDPVGHGKKAEDLLWRKVFYDVIVTTKQLLKVNGNASDPASLLNHLAMGMGTYHHLLFRIQSEYNLEEGAADFLLTDDCQTHNGRSGSFKLKVPEDSKKMEWARTAFHRSLICLGDLARYRHELNRQNYDLIAERYYAQAASFNPCLGMPHNQQGTLAGGSQYGCDAAYHYMRCLVSTQSFEGSEENLERVLEKGQKLLSQCPLDPIACEEVALAVRREMTVKRCITRFLQFCEVCFMEEKVYHSSVQLEQLCQQILQDFYDCMQFPTDNCEYDKLNSDGTVSPLCLDNRLVFRIVVMALMCVHRLSENGSSSQSAAIAFALALFSHLLHYVVVRLQRALGLISNCAESSNLFSDVSSANGDHPVVDSLMANSDNCKLRHRNRARSRLLRRRRHKHGSCISLEDSDLSEGEHSDDGLSDSDDAYQASDISEAAEVGGGGGSSSEEDTQELDSSSVSCLSHSMSDIVLNGECRSSRLDYSDSISGIHSDPDGKRISRTGSSTRRRTPRSDWPNLSPRKVLAAVEKEELLMAVKVCMDWLRCHPNIFTACAQGSQLLWSRVATLLNMVQPILHLEVKDGLKMDVVSCAKTSLTDLHWNQQLPLPEDVALRNFLLLRDIQSKLDYKKLHHVWLSTSEQAVVRMACLHQFGLALTKCAATNLVYDKTTQHFRKNLDHNASGRPTWPATDQEHKHAVEVQRKHLMENMAHLWLQAEVTELESTVRSSSDPQHMSPYLVLTTTVLTDHSLTLRQLLSTKRFIVVIPNVVIQHLDWLKRESLQAREAIRWLEVEFHRGNRYLRAQKQHEQISLYPMKYPKRKDKESWDFFQVLECCNFLAQQAAVRDTSSSLVTLLVGAIDQNNMEALAETAGIKLEPIEAFLSKWQQQNNSAKCHQR